MIAERSGERGSHRGIYTPGSCATYGWLIGEFGSYSEQGHRCNHEVLLSISVRTEQLR